MVGIHNIHKPVAGRQRNSGKQPARHGTATPWRWVVFFGVIMDLHARVASWISAERHLTPYVLEMPREDRIRHTKRNRLLLSAANAYYSSDLPDNDKQRSRSLDDLRLRNPDSSFTLKSWRWALNVIKDRRNRILKQQSVRNVFIPWLKRVSRDFPAGFTVREIFDKIERETSEGVSKNCFYLRAWLVWSTSGIDKSTAISFGKLLRFISENRNDVHVRKIKSGHNHENLWAVFGPGIALPLIRDYGMGRPVQKIDERVQGLIALLRRAKKPIPVNNIRLFRTMKRDEVLAFYRLLAKRKIIHMDETVRGGRSTYVISLPQARSI